MPDIEDEMKEIIASKRKNLEWQLEYLRVHFPWMTGNTTETSEDDE